MLVLVLVLLGATGAGVGWRRGAQGALTLSQGHRLSCMTVFVAQGPAWRPDAPPLEASVSKLLEACPFGPRLSAFALKSDPQLWPVCFPRRTVLACPDTVL